MIFTVHCMGWNDRQGIGCQGMGTVRIFMEEMATVSEVRERETATNNTPVYIIYPFRAHPTQMSVFCSGLSVTIA